MTRDPVRWAIALVLTAAIVLACVMPKRPPVVIMLGTGMTPAVEKDRDQFGFVQISVPMKPVGIWFNTRFGTDRDSAVVQGGLILFLPGEEPEKDEELEKAPVEVPIP